jgi:hypothetical protein
MFKNLDSDNDTEVRHTCSGRVFRGVHLKNLFKQNYGEKGFYSGEEADLTDGEHSELAGIEEGEVEEPRWDEPKTFGTVQTVEVSIVNPLVISKALGNKNNQNHQSS